MGPDHHLIKEDLPKAVEILKEFQSKVGEVTTHVKGLKKKVEEEEISTAKGVSFLEVKYQLLLSYLINLTHLLLKKTSGKSIEGDESIDRMVELRTVLEKMRPIDQKLKYQIDKVIKTATTGSLAENDPLRFRPNPENLDAKLQEEDDEESGSDDEQKEKKPKVYRPPKLAAVHYDGDETIKDKKERHLERAKKRALSSSIMQDLRNEYDEGPEELVDTHDLHRVKEDKAFKERTRYEEKNFVRMAVSKKEMNAMKQLRTMSTLDELTHFGDIRALNKDAPDSDDEMPRKKRKLSSKKGKGKKKGKKFRRH